jgi:hypothetical protein
MDRLQGIFDAALGRRVHDHGVCALAEAGRVVGGMVIAGYVRIGCQRGIGKRLQSLRAICQRVREANSSFGFGGDEHHRLSRAFAADESLIDFNVSRERLAVRPDQRGADLVQPRPGRFVGAKPHDPLQVLGRDTVAPQRHFEHGAEPDLERLAGLFEQRTDVRLVWWPHAAHSNRKPSRSIQRRVPWQRAQAGYAPPRVDPMRDAVILGRKLRLELGRRLGKITPQVFGVSSGSLRQRWPSDGRSVTINFRRH